MPFNPYDTLPVADEALEKGGVELLRAGLADEELYVTLRRAFEGPDQWGGVLADITLHVATLYSQDGDLTKDGVITLVAEAFAQSLRRFVAVSPRARAARGSAQARPAKSPLARSARPKAPAKGKAKVQAKTGAKVKAASRLKARSKPAKPAAKLASKAMAGRKGARGRS